MLMGTVPYMLWYWIELQLPTRDRTRLTPATSAPGLGSTSHTLRRDCHNLNQHWAHPSHICAGTGQQLRQDWAHPCHIRESACMRAG
jgi:hypothetical protein